MLPRSHNLRTIRVETRRFKPPRKSLMQKATRTIKLNSETKNDSDFDLGLITAKCLKDWSSRYSMELHACRSRATGNIIRVHLHPIGSMLKRSKRLLKKAEYSEERSSRTFQHAQKKSSASSVRPRLASATPLPRMAVLRRWRNAESGSSPY